MKYKNTFISNYITKVSHLQYKFAKILSFFLMIIDIFYIMWYNNINGNNIIKIGKVEIIMKKNMNNKITKNNHLVTYSWAELSEIFEGIAVANMRIRRASTLKEIRFQLHILNELMRELYKKDVFVESIRDISVVIRRIRLHDATRAELCDLLTKLYNDFDEKQREEFMISIGFHVLRSISLLD